MNNLESVYRKHKDQLLYMATCMTGRRELAEELIQEMFVSLIVSGEYIREETAKAFLFKCLIWTNGRRRKIHSLTPERDWNYNTDDAIVIDNTTEEQLNSNSESKMISDKINNLSFDKAMLVNEVIYTDVRETSKKLGLSYDATKQRYIANMAQLRKWLRSYYNKVYGGTNGFVRTNRRIKQRIE